MAFIYSTAVRDSAAPDHVSTGTAGHMPAEWEAHQRTWMAFPPPNDTFGPIGSPTLDRARAAWTTVAQTIARHEPVTVVADPRDATAAREWLGMVINYIVGRSDHIWVPVERS